MAIRYFKAAIGYKTYFRSSTKILLSAVIGRFGLGFSAKPGGNPAIEITKSEFDALSAIRDGRLAAKGQTFVTLSDNWVES